MRMPNRCVTEYGKQIKKRLIDIDQSQAWLIEEVKAFTGLYFDRSYLNKIMTGAKRTPSIITAINKILELDSEQESA